MTKLTRRKFNSLGVSALGSAWVPAAWPFSDRAVVSPEAMNKLPFLSLTEVSGMIRTGKVTSTELVNALLDRITVYNPKVNCFVTVMRREALA